MKTASLFLEPKLNNVLIGCSKCGHAWHPKGCDAKHGWELPADYQTCPACGQHHAPIERARIARPVRLKLPARVARWLESAPGGRQRAFEAAIRRGMANA